MNTSDLILPTHLTRRAVIYIRQASGQPFRLTDEDLRQLAEKAKGMDAQRLRKVSTLHPDDIEKLIEAIESLENR